jgi:hypothetical protein
MFNYRPFKISDQNTSKEESLENIRYNLSILRDGVTKLACLDVRPCSRGERMDYQPFAPVGCYVNTVEIYENGAMNIFVRNNYTDQVFGVISVRPMKPYNAGKEYKISKESHE